MIIVLIILNVSHYRFLITCQVKFVFSQFI